MWEGVTTGVCKEKLFEVKQMAEIDFCHFGAATEFSGTLASYWPMKLKDLPQFWKKDTFSRLQEGRSWGSGWGGCYFRHTWWGAGGALDTHI